MASIAPLGIYRAFDDNGDPLSGGKLYTYEAGTTTPKATYTTEQGNVSNSNPVVLDASGYANVWLGDGGYKFVLKNSADNTIFTTDDINGQSSSAFGGDVNNISTNTAITTVYANSVNIVTGSPTLSLLPASSAGEGFYIVVKNEGTGTVIIDPDGSETIDGASTLSLLPGNSAIVITNGIVWYTAILVSNGFTGIVSIGGTSASAAGLSLAENTANGTNKITVKAPAVLASDYTLVLPIDDGLPSQVLATDGSGNTSWLSLSHQTCDGRLTLTTQTPVTTTDVIGAGTVYFTPYKGNNISLWNGTTWDLLSFLELSISLATGFTSGKPYDVFAYNNAGTVALETVVWTNDTTRATGLALVLGVYTKSGDPTRRYIGTFYTTAATTTEDSEAKRFVWNYYNRAARNLKKFDTTDNWSYSIATWRQSNAAAANQLDVMIGLSEDNLSLRATSTCLNSATTLRNVGVSIGLNSTTAPTANAAFFQVTDSRTAGHAFYTVEAPLGRNFYAWLEIGNAAATQTWYGDDGGTIIQSGIFGTVYG